MTDLFMVVEKQFFRCCLLQPYGSPRSILFAAAMGKIDRPSSLCRVEEQVFFTCVATGSSKLVSFCGPILDQTRLPAIPLRHTRRRRTAIPPGPRQHTTRLSLRPLLPRSVDRTEYLRQRRLSLHHLRLLRRRHKTSSPLPVSACAVTANKRKPSSRVIAKPTSKLRTLESIVPRDNDNPMNQ